MNLQQMKAAVPAKELPICEELAAVLKPTVQEIENSMPVTKNHYGRYMNLLIELNEKYPKSSVYRWGFIVMIAGANEQGVKDAIKVIKG